MISKFPTPREVLHADFAQIETWWRDLPEPTTREERTTLHFILIRGIKLNNQRKASSKVA